MTMKSNKTDLQPRRWNAIKEILLFVIFFDNQTMKSFSSWLFLKKKMSFVVEILFFLWFVFWNYFLIEFGFDFDLFFFFFDSIWFFFFLMTSCIMKKKIDWWYILDATKHIHRHYLEQHPTTNWLLKFEHQRQKHRAIWRWLVWVQSEQQCLEKCDKVATNKVQHVSKQMLLWSKL